jgi:monoamine oxidase
MAKVDVLVIGAGLAGLSAAEKVVQAGYSCVVLEARDRVGGRSWSQEMPSGEVVVDLGAAWINDTNQGRMYALAQRFGAELIEQNTTGKCVLLKEDGERVEFEYGELPMVSAGSLGDGAIGADHVADRCGNAHRAGKSARHG